MKPQKPKVGFLPLTGEWLNAIGSGRGFYQNLPGLAEEDSRRIVRTFGGKLDIVNPGIVSTPEKVSAAVEIFKKGGVDVILLCYLMWGEDYLLLDLIKKFPKTPLLLWCYTPTAQLPQEFDMRELFRRSGPVAAVQASGPLKRIGRSFGFAFGSLENARTVRQIIDYCLAAKIASELKKTQIGLLPSVCRQMSGTFVDESRLRKQIGPSVRTITVDEYQRLTRAIPLQKIQNFVRALKEAHPVSGDISDKALLKAGRVSLGLAKVVEKFRLDALAFQDLDEKLHRVMGLRACLSVPSLFQKAVVSMEGDVGAALAMLILKKMTAEPVMYTEWFTFDEGENAVLAGHAGMMDSRLAGNPQNVRIVPDYEYFEAEKDTAAMLFRAKGGRVTLLSIFCDVANFKMIITRGEAIAGPQILEGSPHIYIRLDTPLEELYAKTVKSGLTQHWAVVHQDVVDKLVCLSEILKTDCLTL